jgi:VCBS repeat-containing protein
LNVSGFVFSGSGGTEQVSKTYALDPSKSLTRVAFDFLKVGTWDGQGVAGAASNERLFVYINGVRAFEFTPEEWANGAQPGSDGATGSFSLGGGLTGTFVVTSDGVDVNRYDLNYDWGGSRSYHVELLLSGAGSSVKIGFGNNLNGGAGDESLGIDNVLVTHRLTDAGTITFADPDANDTHSASFTALGTSYVGTFTLDPVNQGANTLAWKYQVDDYILNSLAAGQTIVQKYNVTVSDGNGGTDTET